MPDTSFVKGHAECPVCGALVLEGVRCQWGELPGVKYAIGDEVKWLRGEDGQAFPSFVLHKIEDGKWRWNCGDSLYHDVILFDVLFEADVFTQGYRCPKCATRISAGIAVVREGRFSEIRAILDDEVTRILGASRGKADIVIIREDGTYWPREDWNDHPIECEG